MKFVQSLEKIQPSTRQAKVDSFLLANLARPFTEKDSICTFIYSGTARSVKLAGDFTGWQPTFPMRNPAGTNLWYYNCIFEPDARLDYQFVVDSAKWMLDPLNPYSCRGGYGENSELRMPEYRIHSETLPDPSIPHGSMEDTNIQSRYFPRAHHVAIYLPAGYRKGSGKYPVFLFHDGNDYIKFGSGCATLDHLIAGKKIVPLIAVFVDPLPGEREHEFINDKVEAYSSFLTEELMPVLEKKYSITTDPLKRATAGVSNGGNIALYLGLKYPDQFGKIGAESSNVKDYILRGYKKQKNTGLEFYLDIGKYDIPELIPLVKNMEKILKDKQYSHSYHIWHEGHSWGNWRDHLGVMLQQFFPYGHENN